MLVNKWEEVDWGFSSVVEGLLSKHKALDSVPSTGNRHRI